MFDEGKVHKCKLDGFYGRVFTSKSNHIWQPVVKIVYPCTLI